eukprot:1356407-Amorphochlora_amoeboformis.AAC.1
MDELRSNRNDIKRFRRSAHILLTDKTWDSLDSQTLALAYECLDSQDAGCLDRQDVGCLDSQCVRCLDNEYMRCICQYTKIQLTHGLSLTAKLGHWAYGCLDSQDVGSLDSQGVG